MPYLVSVDETHARVDGLHPGPITTSTRIRATDDEVMLRPAHVHQRQMAGVSRPGQPFDLPAGSPAAIREATVEPFNRPRRAVQWLPGEPAS